MSKGQLDIPSSYKRATRERTVATTAVSGLAGIGAAAAMPSFSPLRPRRVRGGHLRRAATAAWSAGSVPNFCAGADRHGPARLW